MPVIVTQKLTTGYRYQAGVPPNLGPHLIPQLKLYLTTADIALLSQAFTTLTLLLQLSPASTFPEVESAILQDIYPLAHSPLVSGACLDALLGFFGALVEADSQIASHLVPGLVTSVNKANKAEAVPANVAKVVGRVVRSQPAVAAGMIAEFSRSLKVHFLTRRASWIVTFFCYSLDPKPRIFKLCSVFLS